MHFFFHFSVLGMRAGTTGRLCRKRVEVIPDEEGEMYVRICLFLFSLPMGCADEATSSPMLKN